MPRPGFKNRRTAAAAQEHAIENIVHAMIFLVVRNRGRFTMKGIARFLSPTLSFGPPKDCL
jgi:hypothetical protein